MPRIRTIKPEFWTNPQVARCPLAARLLFIGTWNFADDNGNLPRDPEKLKMQVFPSNHDADVDVEPLILALIDNGLLIEYVSATGHLYLNIPTFRIHQVINRPSKPIHPLPDKALPKSQKPAEKDDSAGPHDIFTEQCGTEGSRKGVGSGRERSKPKTIGKDGRSGHNPRAHAYTREASDDPSGDESDTDSGEEGTADPVTPAHLSAVMRRHSIMASPSDPRIITAAEQGITPSTIEAACAEAKDADPTGRIKPGFVLAIAERWTQEAGRMQRDNGHHAPAAVKRGNGKHSPSFDERSQDRKRAYQTLTGRRPDADDGPPDDVIDVDATEVSRHAIPKH